MNPRVERVMKAVGKLQLDDLEVLGQELMARKPAVAQEIARWARAEKAKDWPTMPGEKQEVPA